MVKTTYGCFILGIFDICGDVEGGITTNIGEKPKNTYRWRTAWCALNKYNKANEWTDKSSYSEWVYEGDIICIFLDFINLSLSYIINGKDYGIAFKIKKSKYRLAISSYYKNDSIELLEYSRN